VPYPRGQKRLNIRGDWLATEGGGISVRIVDEGLSASCGKGDSHARTKRLT